MPNGLRESATVSHKMSSSLLRDSRLYHGFSTLWRKSICPFCSTDHTRRNDITSDAKGSHFYCDALAQSVYSCLCSRGSRLPGDSRVVQRCTNVCVDAVGALHLFQGGLHCVVSALQVNLLDSHECIGRDAFDGGQEVASCSANHKINSPERLNRLLLQANLVSTSSKRGGVETKRTF